MAAAVRKGGRRRSILRLNALDHRRHGIAAGDAFLPADDHEVPPCGVAEAVGGPRGLHGSAPRQTVALRRLSACDTDRYSSFAIVR
jgi:hypothetical protein